MLQSPSVGQKLQSDQIEELWQLFTESGVARLEFHEFVRFARLLILMIYDNGFPSEVRTNWVTPRKITGPHPNNINTAQRGRFQVNVNPIGDSK